MFKQLLFFIFTSFFIFSTQLMAKPSKPTDQTDLRVRSITYEVRYGECRMITHYYRGRPKVGMVVNNDKCQNDREKAGQQVELIDEQGQDSSAI